MTSLKMTGGLLLGAPLRALAGETAAAASQAGEGQSGAPAAGGSPVFTPGSEKAFPHFEVAGGPYEIGFQTGRQFAGTIREALGAQGEAWRLLRLFVDSQPASLYETFLAAAGKHAPSVIEELRGWAEGSGVPFRELFILNLKSEFKALMEEVEAKQKVETPGCSTIVRLGPKGFLVAHNEDGDMAFQERMFMLRVRPTGKPSFLCASYPGILPGNSPWVNELGMLMTTNFINTKEVHPGVGRYFLDRLAMEAGSVDQVLATTLHPERAYSFHHIIASARERRAVSQEASPARHEEVELSGLFVHTNHFITPTMSVEQQDEKYVGESSLSRWRVLGRWREGLADPSNVSRRKVVEVLSSHEGRPFSPCRHPEGDVRGATLLSALFDVGERSLRIYRGQPCLGHYQDYAF